MTILTTDLPCWIVGAILPKPPFRPEHTSIWAPELRAPINRLDGNNNPRTLHYDPPIYLRILIPPDTRRGSCAWRPPGRGWIGWGAPRRCTRGGK